MKINLFYPLNVLGSSASMSYMNKSLLSDEQIHLLRFVFKLRIEQMKSGKLDMNYYVESGKFHEDLEDAYIHGIVDKNTFLHIDAIFKDELIKQCFNPIYVNLSDVGI